MEDASTRKAADIRRALVRSDILYRAWGERTFNWSGPARQRERRLLTGFLNSLVTTPSIDKFTVMPYDTKFLDQAVLVVGPMTDTRYIDLPGDLKFHPHGRPGTHFVTLNEFERISDPGHRE